jgi:DNA polymerase V
MKIFGKLAIKTSFHSWATQAACQVLDLNDLVVKNPASTFFLQVQEDSDGTPSIKAKDVIIVDRGLTAQHNMLVVVRLQDELLIKRLLLVHEDYYLVSEYPHVKPIRITPDLDYEIWGVITYVIHPVT